MSLFGNRNAAGPHKKSALAGALGVSSIYAGVRAAKGKSVSYKGAAAGGAALGAARGSGKVATRTAMALGKKGTAAVGKQAARKLVAKAALAGAAGGGVGGAIAAAGATGVGMLVGKAIRKARK